MNEVMSNVSRTQSSQFTSASKVESQPITPDSSDVDEAQSASSIDGKSKYDTLELSNEYREYRTQGVNATPQEDVSLLKSDNKNDAASAVTESEASESTSETYNLSQYSESELKDMLTDGKITRSEYNIEIASRQAEDSSETAESTQSNNSIMTEE